MNIRYCKVLQQGITVECQTVNLLWPGYMKCITEEAPFSNVYCAGQLHHKHQAWIHISLAIIRKPLELMQVVRI